MIILGIDPGARDSGLTWWDTEAERVIACNEVLNIDILPSLRREAIGDEKHIGMVVIEDPQPQRRPASEDFMETVKWAARFREALEGHFDIGNMDRLKLIPYREVSAHFCKIVNAKEAFVKKALVGRFGEPGTKTKPGKLFGTKGHGWSALAVAVCAADRLKAV